MRTSLKLMGLVCLGVPLLACSGEERGVELAESEEVASTESELGAAWHFAVSRPLDVFVMDNDFAKNSVVAFRQTRHGALERAGVFPTGGRGSGDGLGSQGAVVLSEDSRFLYVVNPGSNEVSAFELAGKHLVLRDIVPSGGARPISLTLHGDLLYVLNDGAGAAGNISGFRAADGKLSAVAGAIRPLSEATAVGPAQIGFGKDGHVLIVTEKATNRLTTYAVAEDGVASEPMVTESHGQTPFGFSVDDRGYLYVSEAFGGAEGASAVSSYSVDKSGALVLIDGSVPTHQTAACWLVVSGDGRYAYTTNAGSDSVSGYTIQHGGMVELFADGGATGSTGDGPADLDFDGKSRLLYVLNGADDSIDVFRARRNGALVRSASLAGLPPFSAGLAAR